MGGYGPLCTLFYDAEKPRAPAAEIAWFAQRLPRDTDPALELMCGSGRLLLPLVEQGCHVHGVDVSAAMLASCEARLRAAGCRSTLFRQDIAELNVPFRYAAAFAAAGSFQLITDVTRARAALERIRAHLVDPGVLLLDMFVPADALQRLGAALVEVRTAQLDDGTRIALRSETTTHAEARLTRIRSRYVHRRGSQRLAEETDAIALTWYPADEIATLVADVGFRDVEIGPATRPDVEGQGFSITARI